MAAEKIETPIAGAGSMPAPTPEQVRVLGLRVAELDVEIAADRRDIVHWYRENVDGADAKSEDEIRALFEQAEHKGAIDVPLKRAKAYIEAFAKKSTQRKVLTEALAAETVAATEAASARAACELRALVPGYEPLNPAARAVVTSAVTDKALSVLLDDTANLRVLGEVGARVMAVVRESEERAAKRLVETEERATERTAVIVRESEDRAANIMREIEHRSATRTAALIRESEERTAALIRTSEERMLKHFAEGEARIAAALKAALGGSFKALLESPFVARLTGVPAKTLRRKHSAEELKLASFTAAELLAAGFDSDELKAAGFFTEAMIEESGGYCNPSRVNARKFAHATPAELKAAGFTVRQLQEFGFRSVAELKKAGFSGAECREAGFSAWDLSNGGFSTYTALRAAGVTAEQLRREGFERNPEVLRAAGYTAADMKAARFTEVELKKGGFSAAQLKAVGCNTFDLKAAGYDLDALAAIGAGCTCHSTGICLPGWGANALEWKR